MTFPVIIIDSATGSNSAASGAGPTTALTGTDASFTGSVITLDGSPSLAGVAVDGTHAIYMVTSTGVRYFQITAKDDTAKTVTVTPNPAGTSTGRSWAIGGRRLSLNDATTRRLIDDGTTGDARGGWIIQFASGHTETITSRIVVRISGDVTNGPVTLQGTPNAATVPVITFDQNTDLLLVSANYFALRFVDCRNTNATKTLSYVIRVNSSSNPGIAVEGVIANHATNKWFRAFGMSGSNMSIVRCSIGNCEDAGIASTATGGAWSILENTIFDCGSHGIVTSGANFGINVINNIFNGNGGDGINFTGGTDGRNSGVFKGNIFYDNTGSGVEIPSTTIALPHIVDNIFVENRDHGIRSAAGGNQKAMSQIIDGNAYYNNTSGETTGVTVETNKITLTADPFVNAAAGDFNINDTAGGGTVLRAATVVLP